MLSNIGYYAFTVVLNIWFVPYLIGHLGVAAYGLVPLASTVVGYFSVVTLVLNSAVGRYLTIALERNDAEEALSIFNTSLFGGLGVLLPLAVPLCFLAFFPGSMLQIPTGLEGETTLLFLSVAFSFCVSVAMSPFELATYCRDRFDVRNVINLAGSLVRIGLVVVLFSLGHKHVWCVGLGILAATLVQAVGSYLAWRWLLPEMRVSTKAFSWECCKHLLGSGWWIAVNQVGTILFLSIDLVLANRFLGPEVAGRYATCLQWPSLLRGIGMALAGVFGPTVMALYARRNVNNIISYTSMAVKLMGLGLALPVGLICAYAAPLLTLWVGKDFTSYAPVIVLMVFHLSFNQAFLPSLHIPVATNNVRLPGIMQLFFGGLNAGLALTLLSMGYGVYALAISGAVVLTLRNILFAPLYAAVVIGKPWWTFESAVLPCVIATVIVALTGHWLAGVLPVTSWMQLVLHGAGLSIAYAAVCLLLFRVGALRLVMRAPMEAS
jgi:membrane protein EpsK